MQYRGVTVQITEDSNKYAYHIFGQKIDNNLPSLIAAKSKACSFIDEYGHILKSETNPLKQG